ncbi:MAG: TIGR02680 family protein [Peptostreptococcaceae bacterium]
MKDRFIANKFGVFNFWYYYDLEEFELSDGKIIFRGTNGSGKSVTTQSFIPLLLDGDKRPHRIDPFQTKARKIDNYLLMEEDDEDRIAYLYIEFKKPSSETYMTIGMGLRARKGKNTDSWYFILKDGRRINEDVKLYKMQGEKLPLTAKEFKNALGDANVYTSSQSEYMRKVNEHLFGYSNIDDYKDLLNLLIELRSPKLSKDFKPSVIYNILEKSLSTLSDEDLRPMAEAMDNMDTLNGKLEELERSIKACENLKNVFDKYNLENLYKKSTSYNNKLVEVKKEEENIKNLIEDIKHKEERLNIKKEKINELKLELDKSKLKEESLKENEGFKIRDNITKKEEEAKKLAVSLSKEENKHKEKTFRKVNYDNEIDNLENDIYKKEKQLKDLLEDELYYREESYFVYCDNFNNELNKRKEYDFESIHNEIDSFEGLISKVYSKMLQYENTLSELNKNEELKDSKIRDIKIQENKLENAYEYLTNIKTETTEAINTYMKNTKELIIEPSIIKDIFRQIYSIENGYAYIEITNIVKEVAENLRKELNNNKITLEHAKKIKLEESKLLEKSIEKLKSQEEVFKENEDSIKCKEILENDNIEYEDFYKTIYFKEDVDMDTRKIIETSLLDMGILQSLVVPIKYKDKIDDLLNGKSYKILYGENNECSENISKYFDLEKSSFNKSNSQEIINILSGISLKNENSTYVRLDKGYKIGILRGGSSTYEYNPKYIGSNSREKYRKEQIDKLNNELSFLKEEIEDIKISINTIVCKEKDLQKEVSDFPSGEEINTSIKLIQEELENLNKEQLILNSLEESYYRYKKEFEKIKIEVFEETNGINIPKNIKSYEEAKANITNYRKTIIKISDVHKFIISRYNVINSTKEIIEDLVDDIDNIYGEIIIIKDSIKLKNEEINSLKEVLTSMNLGELEKELEIVTSIINKHPNMIRSLELECARLEESIVHTTNDIKTKNIELESKNNVLKAYETVLDNELSLKYIDEINELSKEESIKWIIKNYNKYNIPQKQDILKKVYDSLNSANADLLDYNLRNIDLFNEYEKSDNEEINKILDEGRRIDIRFKINKKDISIYKLYEFLNSTTEAHKLLIGDKEREVFEDILINTLSTKINARVNRARRWVEEINLLMENMDTSNGLKLSLKWIPKKADSDTELDVKNLTNILSKPHFINENERKDIANHFKTQLRKQKRILNEDNSSTSYQAIIKEVLDYRQWYEFKLLYSKSLSKKNELTDNAFFTLSGGEKAMAMYIPLFAAVNARYNAADKRDCPRIIALDEAFAGVDEQNISHMFRLIESLSLDYVLNSQALWGTYDSVKNLAIYELIRQGEDMVIPIKYNWNGKERTTEMSI